MGRKLVQQSTASQRAKFKDNDKERNQNKRKEREENRKKRREERDAKRREKNKRSVLSDSFLQQIAPFGNIHFKSNYFQTGMFYGTVATLITDPGGVSNLPPMWGSMKLIPVTKDEEVKARLIVHMQTRSKDWVQGRLQESASVSAGSYEEAVNNRQSLDASISQRRFADGEVVAFEIGQGASYLDVAYKIIIYAPTLSQLESAKRELSDLYMRMLGSARLTEYLGQQQEDYSNILANATNQLGLHDGFTSIEAAGIYPFVSQGWLDEGGSYIGFSEDLNPTPVLWDSETVDKLAIVASNDNEARMVSSKEPMPFSATAGWLTFMMQSSLLANRRVYEIVLKNEDISNIGHDLSNSTHTIDMSQGTINPLQGFGDVRDELQLFNVLINKLKYIMHQMNSDLTKDQISLFSNALEEFYIQERLWSHNPSQNRDRLRLVQLRDHTQFPRWKKLVAFLGTKYLTYAEGTATQRQNAQLAAEYLKLSNMANEILNVYGYLFDVHTTVDISELSIAPRNIFQFGSLLRSGEDVLMAQFINTLSFIVSGMSNGDVIHIHGAELMSDKAWDYLREQMNYLSMNNIRLVLGFSSTTDAVNCQMFDKADTVIMGQMSKVDMDAYASRLSGTLPHELVSQITGGDPRIYYIRRNRQNMTFYWEQSF